MPKQTRRMPRAAQVKFANAWLEAQGIEKQTIDTHALIDGSLSYEENIKNLKKILNLAGRSKKKATRTMSASECDVSIGNYAAGMNGRETKRACACGDPDACDDLERKAAKPKAKPKPKPRTKAQTVAKRKRSAQKTMSGKTKPQKKPKKAAKKRCTVVKVKGYTRKCPARRR